MLHFIAIEEMFEGIKDVGQSILDVNDDDDYNENTRKLLNELDYM